jgi:hypothetical protein
MENYPFIGGALFVVASFILACGLVNFAIGLARLAGGQSVAMDKFSLVGLLISIPFTYIMGYLFVF